MVEISEYIHKSPSQSHLGATFSGSYASLESLPSAPGLSPAMCDEFQSHVHQSALQLLMSVSAFNKHRWQERCISLYPWTQSRAPLVLHVLRKVMDKEEGLIVSFHPLMLGEVLRYISH